MNNNKGLANSIIILACTIVVGSSIIALKLPVTINLPSIETKESYQEEPWKKTVFFQVSCFRILKLMMSTIFLKHN